MVSYAYNPIFSDDLAGRPLPELQAGMTGYRKSLIVIVCIFVSRFWPSTVANADTTYI
jgi:hypothetical protein